jgi:hypothetical protein
MPSHAIHLGTAWEPPSKGKASWIRRFGRPSGVGPDDRLVLRCEGSAFSAAWRGATLNDRPVDWHAVGGGVLEVDVTAWIADRNMLMLPAGDEASGSDDPSAARVSLPAAWGRLVLVVVSD